MLPWLRDQHANPHSAHAAGRKAKAVVELARDQVAALLPPGGTLAFTSGATEALNWAIKGLGGSVVTLASEHAAVLDTVAALRSGGQEVTVLPVGGGRAGRSRSGARGDRAGHETGRGDAGQ